MKNLYVYDRITSASGRIGVKAGKSIQRVLLNFSYQSLGDITDNYHASGLVPFIESMPDESVLITGNVLTLAHIPCEVYEVARDLIIQKKIGLVFADNVTTWRVFAASCSDAEAVTVNVLNDLDTFVRPEYKQSKLELRNKARQRAKEYLAKQSNERRALVEPEIVQRLNDGDTYAAISAELGTSKTTISQVAKKLRGEGKTIEGK